MTMLEPYKAYTLFEPDDPRFMFCINGLESIHGLTRHFLKGISCQWRPERTGEPYITFRHGMGDFTLYGENLKPVMHELQNIGDFYVFDPTKHLPPTDSGAPIFRRMDGPETWEPSSRNRKIELVKA